ncbi:MAG TPA: hypothetical protein VIL29_08050 [Pseudothermotoga sp.]
MSPKQPKVKSKARIAIVEGPQNKAAKRRVKNSNFALLINTNQRFGRHEEETLPYAKKLTKVVKYILDNPKDFLIFLEEDIPWSRDYVKSITGACYTELGERNGQIHCHAVLCCVHNTKLKLDLDKIKEHICNKMGLKNIFIRCNVLRDSTKHCLENYIAYIKKNYQKKKEKLHLQEECSDSQ